MKRKRKNKKWSIETDDRTRNITHLAKTVEYNISEKLKIIMKKQN